MKYLVNIHFENKAILKFVVDVEDIMDWIEEEPTIAKDEMSERVVTWNEDYVTGIICEPYREEDEDAIEER